MDQSQDVKNKYPQVSSNLDFKIELPQTSNSTFHSQVLKQGLVQGEGVQGEGIQEEAVSACVS